MTDETDKPDAEPPRENAGGAAKAKNGAAETPAAEKADPGDFRVTGPADPDDPASNRSPRFSAVDPRMMERFIELRARTISAIGETVLAMSATPRYRDQTVADLRHLVLEPLMRDRIAIATTRSMNKGDQALAPMTGIAIWATVSEEADGRIREQIKAGAFPVRLKPNDWNSGDRAWLLDVIAPNRKLSTAVVANFRQVCRTERISIHPVVAKMVEPEVLAQLVSGAMAAQARRRPERAAPAPAGEGAAAGDGEARAKANGAAEGAPAKGDSPRETS